MNATKIEYRDEDYTVVSRMNELGGAGYDAACVIAQKYLAQFPKLTAHVMHAGTETVINQATEWQKRNG